MGEKKGTNLTYLEVEEKLRTHLSSQVNVYLPNRRAAMSSIFRNVINRLSAKIHKVKWFSTRAYSEAGELRFIHSKRAKKKILEIFRHLVIYNVSNWYDDLDIQMVETYFNEVESCM